MSAPTRSLAIAAKALSTSSGPRDPRELKLQPQRAGRTSASLTGMDGQHRRIPEDRHAGDLGEGLLEQLQALADNLRAGDEGQSCDIRARPREAGDEATLDGIETATVTMGIVPVAFLAAKAAPWVPQR